MKIWPPSELMNSVALIFVAPVHCFLIIYAFVMKFPNNEIITLSEFGIMALFIFLFLASLCIFPAVYIFFNDPGNWSEEEKKWIELKMIANGKFSPIVKIIHGLFYAVTGGYIFFAIACKILLWLFFKI